MPNGLSARLVQCARGQAEGRVDDLCDRELVERFADRGDGEAFAALVRRHGPMVLGVCRRALRHEPDAEDVFQATFLVLSRKAGGLRVKEAVGPWLFGVARRLALRARRQRHERLGREVRPSAVTAGDPPDELTLHEAREVLDEELARLPERVRGPLVLCYLEGLTRDEAARRLGCPLGTLKARLERGRAVLGGRLARRGLGLPAALATLLLAQGATEAVTPGLRVATVEAAAAFAGRRAVGPAASSKAVALAEAMFKPTIVGKVVAVVLLAVVACGVGAGLSASPSAGRGEPEAPTTPPAARGAELPDRAAALAAPAVAPPAAAPGHVGEPGRFTITPPRPPEPRIPAGVGPWRPHAELAGHNGRVWALGFSPDGARVVSGGDDGRVRVWDVAEAKELTTLPSPNARPIRSVAFGQGGAVAAGDVDGRVLTWDLRKGPNAEPAFDGRGPIVTNVTFGPDGRSLAWARDSGAVERGGPGAPVPLVGPQKDVNCVAFSRDGRTVAWGMDDGRVRLWDAAGQKDLGEHRVHTHVVWCVAFSADGRTVASADHFAWLTVWDRETGRKQFEQGHCGTGPPHALAFSPDGRVVALTGGGTPGAIFLYDLETGKRLPDLRVPQASAHALAFSPCGRFLAAAGSNGTVRVWTCLPASPSGD
jgi:RNA polymerase sigma factor (sigma-70 family)